MNNGLIIVAGETASGKDTFVNKLVKEYPNKFRAVCSYTTRPKRENEIEGKDHYFVNKELFHKLKSTMDSTNSTLAYTKISSSDITDGYEYMASTDELKKSNIYILDPKGIKNLKELFPDKELFIIYITANLSDRVERCRKRSDFKTEFKTRVMNEYEQFLDFNLEQGYDLKINNNNESEFGYSLFRLACVNFINQCKKKEMDE